jgi:hypothetical protein
MSSALRPLALIVSLAEGLLETVPASQEIPGALQVMRKVVKGVDGVFRKARVATLRSHA